MIQFDLKFKSGENMLKENLYLITQSIIALVVVIGSGVLIAVNNPNSDIVVGVAGAIIGYYFSVVTASANVSPSITASQVPSVNDK